MDNRYEIASPNSFPSLEVYNARALQPEDFNAWCASLDVASDKTIETYIYFIKQFVNYLAVNDIRKPTRTDILAYRDYLMKTKKPSTAHGYIIAIKLFFRWAEDQHIYPDIAKNVKGVKVAEDFKKEPLTVNQIRDVLLSIDQSDIGGIRDYALILFMVTTGLREVSVMYADVGDFITKAFDDPESKRTVYREVLRYRSKGHNDKDMTVVIPPSTKAAIEVYLSERRKAGEIINDASPLFTSLSNHNKDGRLTTRSIRRIVTSRFKDVELDLSRISTHSLRHSFATINLLSGGSLEETQKALGHKNINTTMIYSHAINEANNQSSQRVADALFSE